MDFSVSHVSNKSVIHKFGNLLLIVVHGGWGEWSEWGRCDALDNEEKCSSDGSVAKTQKGVHGLETRSRECNSPAPKHGGAKCEGPMEITQQCTVAHCPGICRICFE